MLGVSAAVVWGRESVCILCIYLTRPLVRRSSPGRLTGIFASSTGLYSSGMMIGVPAKTVGGGGRYEGRRGSLVFRLGKRPALGATMVTRLGL